MDEKAYRALREGAAFLDLSGRGKIKLTGEDRARLLHAMTTNHIQQLQPGDGCYVYFLNAQGRILADANVFCLEGQFLLDTEPETREKIYQHLDKFIIADDAALEDVTAALATVAVEGPRSGEMLRALGAPVPGKAFGIAEWDATLVAECGVTGAEGYLLFVPAGKKLETIERLLSAGAAEGDAESFRVVRLEHGKPRYGEEITERYLAQETNQSHALNFQKGCYLGQEIVERVRSRGQIHRVLLPLDLETGLPPDPGVKLTADGKPAAEIASAVYSPGRDKVVALAYVRVEYSQPGTRLALGDVAAVVRG